MKHAQFTTKDKKFMGAKLIYQYLTTDNDKFDTAIICNGKEMNLFTFDQSLYEAIGSIENRNCINHNKLVKLLEVVDILPYGSMTNMERTILTEVRANEIKTFNRINGGNNNEQDNWN